MSTTSMHADDESPQAGSVGQAVRGDWSDDDQGHDPEFHRLGREQLVTLLEHGLTESSYLLDIGCGNLRGGRWLIPLLAPGHYCGIEPVPERVENLVPWLLEDVAFADGDTPGAGAPLAEFFGGRVDPNKWSPQPLIRIEVVVLIEVPDKLANPGLLKCGRGTEVGVEVVVVGGSLHVSFSLLSWRLRWWLTVLRDQEIEIRSNMCL